MELPLETERLTIRRLVSGDLNALFSIYGKIENARYDFHSPWTIEQTEAAIVAQATLDLGAPGVAIMLGASLRETDLVVGCIEITITSPDDGQAEIGFSFNASYTGRGLATESVIAVMGFAFRSLNVHRICAGVDSRNERSWRLMERVGMRREAHFIDANLEDGQWTDDYVYAMLADEWSTRHGT